MGFIWLVVFIAVLFFLFYHFLSRYICALSLGVLLLSYSFLSASSVLLKIIFWAVYAVLFLFLLVPFLRYKLLSYPVLRIFRKVMPTMSDTEREALCSGGVGWTADIFSANPNFEKLNKIPVGQISERAQQFLDGPVAQLCQMTDDWAISRSLVIPDNVIQFIKDKGFFGMIIPEEYGGHNFTATEQAMILGRISAVSTSVMTFVAVPNSLGPGELLLHYGTEEQKKHYLPRLASGQEIPCFALTSPTAGSDAGSLEDHGVVCEAEFEGETQLCIRLNWNKRYITLAPIATLLGLAFKLYDPDNLLGEEGFLGISCALIPTSLEGVVIGRRHLPVNSSFPNGPTQGHDVLIPMSYIIGGQSMIGQGWRMLMECLAVGRGISLPANAGGCAAKGVLLSTAYARIRRQFNVPIGQFPGVQEALIKVVAYGYLIQALRFFTVGIIDQGIKPVVATAITKYNTTEYGREAMNAAMDLHGGKGICMGPNNYLAQLYMETPVAITVEGANILTRSMIIFGQGVIRCHPYVLEELFAAQEKDKKTALKRFDTVFWSHVGFVLSTQVRSFILGLSNGFFVKAPSSPLRRYYQLLKRFSSVLACVADFSMATMGGALKRKENLSGRLADLVSTLYMLSSVLRYHQAGVEGKPVDEEIPLVKWLCIDLLYKFQTQLDGLLNNFPNRLVALYLRAITMPLGRFLKPPSDRLVERVCENVLSPSPVRDRFKQYVDMGHDSSNVFNHMEAVFKKVMQTMPIQKKIHKAEKQGLISGKTFIELIDAAVHAAIVTAEEADAVREMNDARLSITNVDDFDLKDIVFNVKEEG